MNQLIFGVGRSSCTRLAGRRAVSSITPSLGVGAPNPINKSDSMVPAPINAGFSSSNYRFISDGHVATRHLSSMSAEAVTAQSGDGDATQNESKQATKPTPLEWALLNGKIPDKTPGHQIFWLETYGAKYGRKYGNPIYQADFIQLCESSRPGKQKDAKIIVMALKTFKRNNAFILEKEGAWAAVEGIMRSMKPTWKEQDGRPRVRAALFALNQFLDESTGLYYASETKIINNLFDELLEGLEAMEKNNFTMRVDTTSNDGAKADEEGGEEDSEAKGELSPDEKLVSDALQVTEDVVKLLIKRKERPDWDMKKRARRKYLKHLQISGGPYGSTIILASKISVLLGGSAAAQEKIIDPFDQTWWTSFVDDRALKVVANAKKQEEEKAMAEAAAAEKKAAEEAAAAAAEKEAAEAAAAEKEAEEADEAAEAGDDEVKEEQENKEDSQSESQPEDGKKD